MKAFLRDALIAVAMTALLMVAIRIVLWLTA